MNPKPHPCATELRKRVGRLLCVSVLLAVTLLIFQAAEGETLLGSTFAAAGNDNASEYSLKPDTASTTSAARVTSQFVWNAPDAILGNTENDLTSTSMTASLTVAGNWSLGHIPTVSEDATYSGIITGIRGLNAANMTAGSFNFTGGSGTFSIRNNANSATDSTLTLGGAGSAGNSVSGTPADLLYVSTGGTFNLRGDNGGGNTGVLKVLLGQSGNFDAVGTMNISAAISDGGGGFGITKTGAGLLTLSNVNSYSGGTTLASGTLQLSGSGTLGSTSASLAVNSGTLDLNGTSQTVGRLSGTGSGALVTSSSGNASLTVGNGGGSGTFAGQITNIGSIALTKTGAGRQTLTNNNSYTGATVVNGGVLELASSGVPALTGTSTVTVNNGGTLLMSGNNQLNQSVKPALTLAGGKLDAGGFSQGTGGNLLPNTGTIGLGALTLTSSSIIDLTGTSVLHFSDSSSTTWTGTLSIYNWSGTPTTGGGTEQILFGGTTAGLGALQLAQVSFYSDAGTTQLSNTALILADGEIVPGIMTAVPEPSTWVAAALALLSIAYARTHRFAQGLLSFLPSAFSFQISAFRNSTPKNIL